MAKEPWQMTRMAKAPWQMTRDEYATAFKWLPEYFGASPSKTHIIITKSEAEEAINQGRNHVFGSASAQILEIAMIPKVWKYLHKLSPGGNLSLKRVKNGYVLEGWNPPERPFPDVVHDGLRRNFHIGALESLRHLILSKQEGEDIVIPEVEKQFKEAGIRFHNIGGIKPKRKRKEKPLPPDAINPQVIPFNSERATCYGKRIKTGGFRVYCRLRKE